MAGMATAWRLSEPGWRDEFESITVYQRGWRLGGKGASSRGPNGRVEEHGLHIWLGYYENAFRLLRECYAELDRPTSDPDAPLGTWRDAMIPAGTLGLEDRDGDGGSWRHWLGRFSPNDQLPGEPDATGRDLTVVEFVRRALGLVVDFLASLPPPGAPDRSGPGGIVAGGFTVAMAAAFEAARLAGEGTPCLGTGPLVASLDAALEALGASLGDSVRSSPDLRRTWHLVSVMTAVVRGIVAEGLLTNPEGFRAINDEDFVAWIVRHGASPEVADFAFMRGLYDLVFGYADADPERRGFGAGLAVFLTGKMLFDYKGAIFWKMAAGMGDVVFAPLYEAMVRRGVTFEFFHRVDGLHVSADRTTIDAVTVGRQVRLAPGREGYDPLVRVKGLPCFPSAPLVDQLADAEGIVGHPLESHFCEWPDAEQRVLWRGEDFDVAVLAISVGMAESVCSELVEDRSEWRDMVANVSTVATQAFQIWLRTPEPELGWDDPGSTVSGYVEPFNTWASMPQLIDMEDWPESAGLGSIAYFCGTLDVPAPAWASGPEYAASQRARVREHAVEFLEHDLGHLLPGVMGPEGFRWELLCGPGGQRGPDAFDSQYWVANVDPSDRYVQALPGSDRYRLRPDESGYDNLFLAGDWTDSGLNAGCIEAAVLSGLQAANAVRGRARNHRIAGYYLP